ncbi:MAG: AI-2E family transporter [Methylophilus sp.]
MNVNSLVHDPNENQTSKVSLELSQEYVKSISLRVIASVAVIYMMDLAEPFLVTLLLGVFLAFALNPLIVLLEKVKIHRVLGVSLIMLLLVALVSMATLSLSGQVESIINQLPSVSKKITALVVNNKNKSFTNIQKVQIAASQVQKATADVGLQKNGTMQVVIKNEPFKVSDFLWRGSLGFAGAIGEFVTVMFLAYFLLISGDTFKRKLVKLTGPTISSKKITINILHDINQSIQSYMLMLLVTNIMVAVFMWVVLRMLGLENAGAWAVAAGLIHFIPYFGPIVIASALGSAAFMQFGTLSMVLLIAGISLLVATVVGVFITTWMTGRIAKMNSAAVFISLIFFTWLWGVWGMLLGIPLVVMIKVISEYVDELQPIAELLGE